VYPIILEQLSPEISLWVPDVAVVKTVYDKLKEQDPNLPFPYWTKIWASSKAMVTFLQEEPHWIENKKLLEIGAGIGIPSFFMAQKAREIIISDYDNEAVSLANKNIAHLNLTNAISVVLNWNHIPDYIIADTILLSDTNYNPTDFETLVFSITSFINKGSVVILATPNRITANLFLEKLNAFMHKTKNYLIIEGKIEKEIAVFVFKK